MKTVIRNIGTLISGDIHRPLLEGDSIRIEDGRITAVGTGLDDGADTVIDAKGSTVMPGLIDSHCHPVFGDFTPRQRTLDFIDSGLNGGVTTMTSVMDFKTKAARDAALATGMTDGMEQSYQLLDAVLS